MTALPISRTIHTDVQAAGPSMADLMRFGVRFAPETGDGGGDYVEPEETVEEDSLDDRDASNDLDDDDAIEDAFLKNLKAPQKAERTEEKAPEPAATETPAEVAETLAGDDHKVEVKVGEETHKVTVAELKRLFGQEASLTQKGQEVAAARDEARSQAAHAKAVVAKALAASEERFAGYKDLDFWALSKKMDDASFAQLRKDAQAAHDDVTYLRQEAEAVAETVAKVDQAAIREASRSAVANITDAKSANYIEGWNDTLYAGLMEFAESKGLKSARQIVDPSVIKLLHMASLYQKGLATAATKVTAAATQPARPLRSGGATTVSRTGSDRSDSAAMSRLRSTGSAAAAEDAFLSRMRGRA